MKYYNADDAIRAIAENLAWKDNRNKGKYDCTDGWEEWIEDAEDVVYNLPTIEVSEDCVSKAYLEQELERYILTEREVKTDYDLGRNTAYERVFDIIEDAPSVVPTQSNVIQHVESVESVEPTAEQSSIVGEWIPCSERLPEEEGMYLVSAKKHSWDSDFDDVVIAYHSPNHTWFNVSSCDILAWMPLPKPWKGADDED